MLQVVTNKSHVPGSLLLVRLPVIQPMTWAVHCPHPQVNHSRDLINPSIHLPRDTSINLPQDLKTYALTHTHTHWRSLAGYSAPRTDDVTFKDILPLHTCLSHALSLTLGARIQRPCVSTLKATHTTCRRPHKLEAEDLTH